MDTAKGRRTRRKEGQKMGKSKLDFSNPILSPAAVGSLSEQEEKREPTERKKQKRGAKRIADVIRNDDGGNSAQEGLRADSTRFSCICKVENVKKIKDYAYTQRIPIKQAMDEIIESFFDNYDGDLLDHREGKGSK